MRVVSGGESELFGQLQSPPVNFLATENGGAAIA